MVHVLRNINTILGMIAALCLLWQLAQLWGKAQSSQRLRFMSLILIIATVTYGTYEVLYLGTFYRVPLLTISLSWTIASVIVAHTWSKRE